MATAAQKIILSPSRDIPFNKLVLSQSNVRRVKAGVSVEELAEPVSEAAAVGFVGRLSAVVTHDRESSADADAACLTSSESA